LPQARKFITRSRNGPAEGKAPGVRATIGGIRRRDRNQYRDSAQQERHCFCCLEGWVFIGSRDHDGKEIYEAYRCRKCGGSGRHDED